MITQSMKVTQPFDVASALEHIRHTADQLFAAARVNAVYGEPITQNGTLVVPSAEVFGLMGYGLGFGNGPAAEPHDESHSGGFGLGSGGMGRVFSRPVALIVLTPNGVRVQPIVDVTKIGLAALAALGFVVSQLLRMSNRRRALKALKSNGAA